MNDKKPNVEIGCNVKSCRYHSGSVDNCTLPGITVEPRPNGGTGMKADESICGNYEAK